MKKKLLFMLSCFLCLCIGAMAQVSVSGKVTDAAGSGMEGVTVSVRGTTTSTTTSENGMFSLNVPSTNSVLVFTFVGYATQEIAVGNRTNFNITLSEARSAMDTLVVIGYGTARKRDYTGSVTSVNSKIISTQANSTVTRALEGVVPGIQVSSIDGQPGLDMGIRLRGAGSTSQNSSNALIVIDGVPTEYPNALSSINPKDIESISVLKDAASTAVYGARGANGVLLVTTKRGSRGKPNISVETRLGYNFLGTMRYDRIDNAKDIYEHAWLAIYNSVRYGVDGGSSTNGKFTTNVQNPNMSHEAAAEFASAHLFDYTGSTTNFSRNLLGNWMLYEVPGAVYTLTGVTDPTKGSANASATMSGAYLVNPDGKLNPNARPLYEAGSYENYFFERMFRQEHTLSASGGTDKMDYFVSLGMLEDPSYVRGSKFKRYNVRSNVNAQLTSWLKVGANMGYSYRNTQSPATRFGRNPGTVQQNVFRWTNGQNPLIPLFARDQQGNIIKNADGTDRVHDNANVSYTPLGVQPQFPNGTTSQPLYLTNLIKLLDKDIDRRESHDLNLKGYATISFLKDFKFTANLSYDRFSEVRLRYGNRETGAVVDFGAMGQYYANTNVFNAQQLLNWNKGFGNHSVTALLGHEYYQYKSDLLNYASAYSLVNDFTGYANFVSRYNSSFAPFGAPGGGGDLVAMESYFGRVSYNYSEKYFLEGSARRDGSSKFRYEENRWGTFWSIGAGWRLTGEKFMEGTGKWLNDLKVRASYGVIGNQSGIGNYSGYQLWSYGVAKWQEPGGGAGVPLEYTLTQGAAVNTALTWENTHTFDAGIDFSLWNRRINGSIDYYNKNTVNSVFSQPIAYSLGQRSLTLNNAEIVNRGVEVEVNIDLIRNQNFRWNVGLNGTHYRTILLKVPSTVLSAALGGKYTADIDGWGAASGGATSAGQTFLRGEGMDYYNLYLYKYAGVDQSTGLPLFNHTVTQKNLDDGLFAGSKPGDIVSTTNYTMADRYSMGSAIPKWIGGFTTTLQYKNFDFMAILAYQIGGKFLSVEYANHLYRSGNIGNALSAELLGNTWTPENRDAKFPMTFYGDTYYTGGSTHGSWQYSDMALFDASYLNIKNITLGYNFGDNIAGKIKAKNIRVYASADNIAMFTSHSGIDPRMSLVGGMEVGAAVYLPMSTMSVGLNVNF